MRPDISLSPNAYKAGLSLWIYNFPCQIACGMPTAHLKGRFFQEVGKETSQEGLWFIWVTINPKVEMST